MTTCTRSALTVFSPKHATRTAAHPHTHQHTQKRDVTCQMSIFWPQSGVACHKAVLSERSLCYGSLGSFRSELFVAGIQLMDWNALDIMALQIERYSFSKAADPPHISVSQFVWRASAGTHEVSGVVYNGSIWVWIMVYFLLKCALLVKPNEWHLEWWSFQIFPSFQSLCKMTHFNKYSHFTLTSSNKWTHLENA